MRINTMKNFFEFSKEEIRVFEKLNTPQKIQDFLNKLPINFEENLKGSLSPREVLKQRRAHCLEAAVFAATVLWYHGEKPLLLDLKTTSDDVEHVVTLFQKFGCFGAISKTNHAVLRYREPVYKTVRELAMSYFHEYFINNGEKTLRSFSRSFDLSKIKDRRWMTLSEPTWEIHDRLDASPHYQILNKGQIKNLRKADLIEIKAGRLEEFKSLSR
jgi:hypothetical protein